MWLLTRNRLRSKSKLDQTTVNQYEIIIAADRITNYIAILKYGKIDKGEFGCYSQSKHLS